MWDRLLKNARVVDPVNGRDAVMDAVSYTHLTLPTT